MLPPINCDPYSGPTCLPGKPRRIKSSDVTAIDLFAGAGGFTSGAEAAGAKVVWAINHHKLAVTYHALNHPHTAHCCEDVFQFNWNEAPLADLILASPSCKAHSQAATGGLGKSGRRGTAPHHDRLRATPEAVVQAAFTARYEAYEANRSQPIVVIENVVDFLKWEFVDLYVFKALERIGYSLSFHTLDAQLFGVPQKRKRVFVIGVPGSTPFDLPDPPKRKAKTLGSVLLKRAPKGLPWIPLEDYPSEGVIRQAKDKLARIKTRLKRKKVPELWTFTYTTGTNPEMPDGVFRTLTAELGGQTYVMKSRGGRHWIRQIAPAELRGIMGFPSGYKLPDTPSLAGKLMGNAVCPPVSEFIVRELIKRA